MVAVAVTFEFFSVFNREVDESLELAARGLASREIEVTPWSRSSSSRSTFDRILGAGVGGLDDRALLAGRADAVTLPARAVFRLICVCSLVATSAVVSPSCDVNCQRLVAGRGLAVFLIVQDDGIGTGVGGGSGADHGGAVDERRDSGRGGDGQVVTERVGEADGARGLLGDGGSLHDVDRCGSSRSRLYGSPSVFFRRQTQRRRVQRRGGVGRLGRA